MNDRYLNASKEKLDTMRNRMHVAEGTIKKLRYKVTK